MFLYLLSEVLLESWFFSSALKTLPILFMLLLFSECKWLHDLPSPSDQNPIFPALERSELWEGLLKRKGLAVSWDIRTRSNFRDYLIDLFFFLQEETVQPFSSELRPIALSQHSFCNCIFLFLPMRSISLTLDKDIWGQLLPFSIG